MFPGEVQTSSDSTCMGFSSHLFQNNPLTAKYLQTAGWNHTVRSLLPTNYICASALERDTKNDITICFQ